MGKRKNSRKDSDKLAAFDPQNVAQEYHEQFADELKDYDYEIGIKNSGDFVAIVPEAACMNVSRSDDVLPHSDCPIARFLVVCDGTAKFLVTIDE